MNVPSSLSTNTLTPTDTPYAGFWIRFAAMVVDMVVVAIPTLIIQSLFGSLILSYVISCIVPWVYFSLMTYYKAATLGKMLMGIRVVSIDQKRLTLKQVLLREIVGKFVSGLLFVFGYIIVAFTSKKQAVHDMLAKTIVVRDTAGDYRP